MSLTAKRGKQHLLMHAFFVCFSLLFILPLVLILSVSLSNEQDIIKDGYKLWPKQIDLTGYKFVFSNPRTIVKSYTVTALFTATGTVLSLFVMSLCAYALSRKYYRFRKYITFFIFFTMIFGGGLVPTYIIITQYLKLGNTIWVYIFPSLVNAFHIIILRTFFQGLPESLIESAKIDGAHESLIFFRIILPLSKPVIATIAVFGVLYRWNDWFTSMIYIRNQDLFALQYLLQKILLEVQYLRNNFDRLPPGTNLRELASLPTESMRMAMCIVVAGPVLMIFPFFQKYFTRGLTIGAVKG